MGSQNQYYWKMILNCFFYGFKTAASKCKATGKVPYSILGKEWVNVVGLEHMALFFRTNESLITLRVQKKN